MRTHWWHLNCSKEFMKGVALLCLNVCLQTKKETVNLKYINSQKKFTCRKKLIMKPKNAYLFIKPVFILTMHNQSVILQQSILQRFQVIADIDLFA